MAAGASSSPTPQSNATWGVSQESLYNSSSPNPVQKYSYSTINDSSARDGGLTEAQLDSQYNRSAVQASGSPYPTYLQQDVNSSTWYQNVSSPYSDVRPTGEFKFTNKNTSVI